MIWGRFVGWNLRAAALDPTDVSSYSFSNQGGILSLPALICCFLVAASDCGSSCDCRANITGAAEIEADLEVFEPRRLAYKEVLAGAIGAAEERDWCGTLMAAVKTVPHGSLEVWNS